MTVTRDFITINPVDPNFKKNLASQNTSLAPILSASRVVKMSNICRPTCKTASERKIKIVIGNYLVIKNYFGKFFKFRVRDP